MRIIIPFLTLILLLSSCYSPRRAARDLRKVDLYFPELIAEKCAKDFPIIPITEIRTKYLQGKDSFIFDTLTVECPDTVKTIRLPVVRNHFRVDTFTRDSIVQVENRAQVELLQLSQKALEKSLAESQAKLQRTRQWLCITAYLSVLSVLAFLALLYRKISKIFSVKSILK